MGILIPLPLRRGTAAWGFNKFRTDALRAFLADLEQLEGAGLGDVRGKEVRSGLAKIVARLEKAPESSWVRVAIFKPMRDIEYMFVDWNSFEGADAPDSRRHFVSRMRLRRNKIAQRMRANQRRLAEEIDEKLVDEIYESFRRISASLPDLFPNLAHAVERYFSVRKPKD